MARLFSAYSIPLGAQKTAELCGLAALWYGSAVICIISSKSAMLICPSPFLLCTTQFITASIFCSLFYQLMNPGKSGTVAELRAAASSSNKSRLQLVVLISVCYTLGFILTNVAFSLANANSVETVKAAEPISSVILGQIFCPEYASWLTYASLLPIWFGVSMACYGDSSFPLWGVVFAMGSNIGFSGRAVATKKLFALSSNKPDETMLFGQISIIGLLLLVPLAIVFDSGVVLNNNWHPADSISKESSNFIPFLAVLALNGLAYTAYNLASFLVLTRTNLVTHAVLNACRRVVIILFSAWFFSVTITQVNIWGIMIAVGGVLWFALAKSHASTSSLQLLLLPQFVSGCGSVTP
jgi:solute carrier family 35, member E1